MYSDAGLVEAWRRSGAVTVAMWWSLGGERTSTTTNTYCDHLVSVGLRVNWETSHSVVYS